MLDIITITADGEVTRTTTGGSLDEMQTLVGGWIEAVDFEIAGQPATLWLNEEGKIEGLPVNGAATALVQHRIMPHDYIAGDVFITGGVDDEGETLGLTPAQLDAVQGKVAH